MPSIMDLLSNNKMGTGDGKITFSLGQGTNFVNEIKNFIDCVRVSLILGYNNQ